jgi:hypothetical protein
MYECNLEHTNYHIYMYQYTAIGLQNLNRCVGETALRKQFGPLHEQQ